ncbi:MAG: metal ABC transporter permease [Fimbriimonadaceae bacterium]|nr:metal ABC transporter permease [Fimbriimonadaceae bacterium]
MNLDYTLLSVATGCAVLGVTSGTLGAYAVLRRQALLADALSHATLPGVVLGFLLTGARTDMLLWIGGGGAALLGAWAVRGLRATTKWDSGTILATVLTVFFGIGVLFLTIANRSPNAAKAGLDHLLFGQAAGLTLDQVGGMAAVGILGLLVATLFHKQLTVLTFDPTYAETVGWRERTIGWLITALLVASIIVGLRAVGVVLTSALAVAPTLAARPWVRSFPGLLILAGAIGGFAGVIGAAGASAAPGIPTGPVVVLGLGVVVVISVLFGKERGVLVRKFRPEATP